MKRFILAVLCIAAFFAAVASAKVLVDIQAEDAQPALNVNIIKQIRRSGKWESGVNKKFVGKTVADVKNMLGLKVNNISLTTILKLMMIMMTIILL